MYTIRDMPFNELGYCGMYYQIQEIHRFLLPLGNRIHIFSTSLLQ